ncbi:restriction endonuclease subunit S [Enterococcus pseudoavium]|uniref:Restriction endonuclease subunit S n=1 Tax=Enterococcus pseudoavium TaxID=44007 RepID=A0AAE4HZZ7_9ENTE|nr:restriction endonuclease subunit S [Enterococcus pseudoavium]MDT2735687.1 restriction endonuclease subunit S [Enterococcus pseudoavium]
MTDKKVPELRFEGFENEWEQGKLGEVSSSYSGGTPSAGEKSYYGGAIPFIRSAEINSDRTELFLTKEGLNASSAKMVEIGDILYALYGATSGEVGISQINGAINQAILAIKPIEGYNSQFIMQWLRLQKQKIIDKYLQGGQGNLSGSIVKDLQMKFPNYIEQVQVGTFFKQLDDTIALHQRKFDLLKQLKQVYLKKLFPRNSETVSELRFADFKDKWEQRKLGEIAEIVRGASPRPIQDPKWFDPNSDIGWLRISDVTEQNGRIRKLEQKISKAGQQKTRVLETPHLLLSIAATVGKPVMNYVKTGVHDGFLIFLNPEFNTEFVFQWLEMFRPQWRKYGQPGSQVNLNSELVQNQKILLPSVEEQKKVAIFFEELDKNITLHKNKLDQLKQLKSAFLQKMFI